MYRPTKDDMTATAKFQKLSLAESGAFDAAKGAKEKLTGWGKVCLARKGKSARQRKA